MKLASHAARAAALAIFFLFLVPDSSSAQIVGAIKSYAHLPIILKDNKNTQVGLLTKTTAPPPSEVLVYGWYSHFGTLLVRLHPGDQDVFFISLKDFVMADPLQWEARMRTDSDIVCARPPPPMRVVSMPADTNIATGKGFKNPC